MAWSTWVTTSWVQHRPPPPFYLRTSGRALKSKDSSPTSVLQLAATTRAPMTSLLPNTTPISKLQPSANSTQLLTFRLPQLWLDPLIFKEETRGSSQDYTQEWFLLLRGLQQGLKSLGISCLSRRALVLLPSSRLGQRWAKAKIWQLLFNRWIKRGYKDWQIIMKAVLNILIWRSRVKIQGQEHRH